MTANALCSLSLDPLLALVCFENQARTLPIVREARTVRGQRARRRIRRTLARVFASKLPESEKLEGVDAPVRDGVPIIEGTVAWAAASCAS